MKTLKLYDNFQHWHKNGVIWVYSDPHFGDDDCKLIDRNWPTPEEQIERINKCVGKNDTLIILGDIGDIKYIKQLKGYKVLIKGNHDKGDSNYKRKNLTGYIVDNLNRIMPRMNDNKLFDEVYDGPVFINGKILLSHEPIKLDFGINIHGHVHNGEYSKKFGNHISVNVCSDVIDFTPKRLDKLLDKFKTKDIHRATIDNI